MPDKVFASNNYFYDDFSTLDDKSWSVDPNERKSLSIIDGSFIRFNPVNSNKFPLLSKHFDENQSEIELRFRISGSPNYGAGIILTDKSIENNTTVGIDWKDILFIVWPNPQSGFEISTVICPKDQTSCTNNNFNESIFSGLSNVRYTLKIINKNDRFTLILDGKSIYESESSERKINQIYLGSPERTGGVVWPILEIDYFGAKKVNNMPVVVIPGLGASWDYASLLNNSLSNNWQIPSFVTVYDSLIKSLENAGLELNKDLFVFSYDWRKPVDKLSEELSAFIIAHFGQNKKVNIVGHSLGGLIARIYEQNYGTDKVDKVITVGSPHLGALDAYSVWENASVWGNVWWEKAALELAVQLNQGQGKNRVDTLRSQAPVIKDLLPVYDYLNINGNLKHWNQLNQKNTYLSDKNNALQPSNITALYGDNEQTKSVLKAKNRSGLDTLIGVWEDGKPIDENPFITTFGDGTVISQSATGGYPSNNFSSNHVGLVSDINVIENILDSFGLDKTKAEIVPSDQKTNLFTAILRSPGRLEICNVQLSKCNGDLGVYIPEYKLFMLPGYNNEDLVVKVYEDGYGEYKLNLGNINTLSTWTVITGKLDRQGQIDNYDIHSASNSLSVYPNGITSENLLKQCKTKMNLLSPNWDKTNLVESILNNNLSSTIRIKYTRLLKMVLRNEIWKAKITKKSDNIYQALDCWENADYEVKNFLSNSSVRINPINYQLMVSRLGNTINSKLATSKNLTAYEAYQAAQNKLNDSKLTTNNSLGMELASSAEQLFLVSLDLR